MNNPKDIFSLSNKNRKNKKHKKERDLFDFEDPWLMVRQWYSSELGQTLLASEKKSINALLEHIFGYNLVQLGCLDKEGLISQSRTSCQFVFESLNNSVPPNPVTQLISDFECLPIQNQSIDAIILPHTLEFEKNPHQILREVERVLVAEGKAVFLGFNPYSPWGFWHKYWELKKRISSTSRRQSKTSCQVPLPSCNHLISQRRLRDWLQLLGFDIELVNEYFYRPPIRSSGILKKLEFMEQAGQFSKILPAGGYLLVATKRVSTLTPIRQGWKLSKKLLTPASIKTAGMKPTMKPSAKSDFTAQVLNEHALTPQPLTLL